VTARVRRIAGALTRAEWGRVGAMAAVVAGLHVVGFGLLLGVVVPAHLAMGAAGAFTAGVGLTAYRSGCGTHSTPTTSRRSTTRPAS
jgi:high-affinity nickel-transport protein